jgi:hypothetical protein
MFENRRYWFGSSPPSRRRPDLKLSYQGPDELQARRQPASDWKHLRRNKCERLPGAGPSNPNW